MLAVSTHAETISAKWKFHFLKKKFVSVTLALSPEKLCPEEVSKFHMFWHMFLFCGRTTRHSHTFVKSVYVPKEENKNRKHFLYSLRCNRLLIYLSSKILYGNSHSMSLHFGSIIAHKMCLSVCFFAQETSEKVITAILPGQKTLTMTHVDSVDGKWNMEKWRSATYSIKYKLCPRWWCSLWKLLVKHFSAKPIQKLFIIGTPAA
jgi:hypothetical protein